MQHLNLESIKESLSSIQKEALHIIEEYLGSRLIKYQAVIKMPTGTGKTGVIGIVSNFYEEYSNILIVSPNGNLPNQIKNEIETSFWSNIGLVNPNVKEIKVCKVKDFYEPERNENVIIITTVQSVMDIYRDSRSIYRKLKQNIDLVIFDEGHREPSERWADVIRDLNKKTILFTATPYRNDELKFSLHKSKYIFNASFNRAVQEGLIKNFEFISIENTYFQEDNINMFSDYVYDLYEDCREGEKILIRCNDYENILRIVTRLNQRYREENPDADGWVAIGLHSNFEQYEEDYLVNNINHIEEIETSYHIFVHQNMMIEGINLPSIDRLIIHGDFGNTRSLIQQIGRVVRKNNCAENAQVYVNQNELLRYQEQWKKYLEYEVQYESKQNERSIIYFDKEFRERFILNNEFIDDLILPKSTIVYEIEDIGFVQLRELLKDNLLKKMYINEFEEYINDEQKLWIICYEKTNYSSLLKTRIYEQTSLECMIAYVVDRGDKNYLFYFDSRGHSVLIDKIHNKLKRIEVEKILSLFPDEKTDFKKVKLNSLALSSNGVLGRVIEGNNIQDTQTNITEKISVCNQVQGFWDTDSDEKVDRYIGISNSKIRDAEKVSLPDYITWVNGIADDIGRTSRNMYFSRFALPVFDEGNYEPSTILLDFFKIIEKYEITGVDDLEINNIESVLISCDNDTFSFNFNNESIEGKIIKIKTKKQVKYLLNIPELRKKYFAKYESFKQDNLEKIINREQSYRVMFKDTNIIYHEGYFFRPNVEFNNIDLDDLDIGRRIFTFKELGECEYEKFGKEPNSSIQLDCWPDDSVFGCLEKSLMDGLSPFEDENIDYLICDDLLTEIADFIAIDELNSRVILIHCKHKKDARKSASSFQDLCGQAVKNVAYIMKNSIDSMSPQNHYLRWEEKWKDSKTYNKDKANEKKVEIETNRIRHSAEEVSGEQLWEKYKRILKKPDSTTEVWLVMGGLSREDLKNQLIKARPEEQIPQLMWLLYSTQETISQYGGILKIFCKE